MHGAVGTDKTTRALRAFTFQRLVTQFVFIINVPFATPLNTRGNGNTCEVTDVSSISNQYDEEYMRQCGTLLRSAGALKPCRGGGTGHDKFKCDRALSLVFSASFSHLACRARA